MSKVKNLFRKKQKTGGVSQGESWTKNDDKLLRAVEDGDPEKVEGLLIKKALSPTKIDSKGTTALHLAASYGKQEVLTVILSYCTDVKATDRAGRTVLHCASEHGQAEVLQMLLQNDSVPFTRDLFGRMPLHYACANGQLNCVKLLMQFGAAHSAADGNGRTALLTAAELGLVEICKELVDRGANVNTADNESMTALVLAVKNGHKNVCEYLVKKGADLQLTDKEGHTAEWYALDRGHTEITQILDRAPTAASWGLGSAESENEAVGFTDDSITQVNFTRTTTSDVTTASQVSVDPVTQHNTNDTQGSDINSDTTANLSAVALSKSGDITAEQTVLTVQESSAPPVDGNQARTITLPEHGVTVHGNNQEKHVTVSSSLEKNLVVVDSADNIVEVLHDTNTALEANTSLPKSGLLQSVKDETPTVPTMHDQQGDEVLAFQLEDSPDRSSSVAPSGESNVTTTSPPEEQIHLDIPDIAPFEEVEEALQEEEVKNVERIVPVLRQSSNEALYDHIIDHNVQSARSTSLASSCSEEEKDIRRRLESFQELEEEHELLNDEYNRLCVEHQKMKDRLTDLESSANVQRSQSSDEEIFLDQVHHEELEHLKEQNFEKEERISELEEELLKFKTQQADEPQTQVTAAGDSWLDSDEDLFGKGINGDGHIDLSGETSPERLVFLLRRQVMTLQEENENLKSKQQVTPVHGSSERVNGHVDEETVEAVEKRSGEMELMQEIEGVISDSHSMTLLNEIQELKDKNQQLQQELEVIKVEYENEKRLRESEMNERQIAEDGQKLKSEMMEYITLANGRRTPNCQENVPQSAPPSDETEELLRDNHLLAAEIQKCKDIIDEQSEKLLELGETASHSAQAQLQLDEVTKECDDLKDELNSLQQNMLYQAEALSCEQEILVKKAAESQKQCERLQEENMTLKRELEELSQHKEIADSPQASPRLKTELYNLVSENQALKSELQEVKDRFEETTTMRIVESTQWTEQVQTLKQENEQLQVQLNSLQADLVKLREDSEKNNNVVDENAEEILQLRNKNEKLQTEVSHLNQKQQQGNAGKGSQVTVNQVRALKKQCIRLQKQLAAADQNHKDIVSTYRTHLISAVQGQLDPEVEKSLHNIIKLRGTEQFC